MLQVSTGFSYSYDLSRPAGRRVDAATMSIDGRVIEPRTRYRVAMSNFLWAGGDRFSVAGLGTDAITVGADLDALIAYLDTHSPIAPGQPARIKRTR